MTELLTLTPTVTGVDRSKLMDVCRWQQRDCQSIATNPQTDSIIRTALTLPVKTAVFRAAEECAMHWPTPETQWRTKDAMLHRTWPALVSTLKVSEVMCVITYVYIE